MCSFDFRASISDAEHHRFYGHLDVPLDGNASQPWVAGFYSSCGPVLYTLKAWCSGMIPTILKCWGLNGAYFSRGRYVSFLENCRNSGFWL